MAYQLPSNISAFFAKTESLAGTAPSIGSTDAIRVIGTPSFKLRGKGIITDRNSQTPMGGGIQTVTGSLGWDVTFQTELYMPDPGTFNDNPLAPLFRACQLGLNESGSTVILSSTAGFNVDPARGNATDIQTVTLLWQESGGKQYEATGCVGRFKMSGSAGDRVMIDWEFKGLWVAPADSTDITPTYESIQSSPLIFEGATLTDGMSSGSLYSLSSWTYDSGIQLQDWEDGLATYGFAIGGSILGASPSLELTVAEALESTTPTYTDAIADTAGNWTLTTTSGARSIAILLRNAQQGMVPELGELSGYRTQKLKLLAPAPLSGTTPQAAITLG